MFGDVKDTIKKVVLGTANKNEIKIAKEYFENIDKKTARVKIKFSFVENVQYYEGEDPMHAAYDIALNAASGVNEMYVNHEDMMNAEKIKMEIV